MSKAKCLKCNDIVESKHRHDFVKCSCKEIFLDGGDEYIRAGANDLSNILIYKDDDFYAAIDRDEALQKLLAEVDADDMFDDDSFLDEDFEDFNLGFQAGAMDERERIIRAFEQADSACQDWAIGVVKGEQNGAD
jgi:hypothetical protein